ncbi:PREDICTED: acyl carrier protein 2, mitochondrial-like [Acropora digitifera]|uniref:acyl carrier protein 2, mitochondrial-like n=1 Tax=Acropora digitifera TaxID=70779 RepID=UPI00077AF252|nr:PREDICTED: acyl carrier protein 2, mitochondrial-like [Acropora digitifera]
MRAKSFQLWLSCGCLRSLKFLGTRCIAFHFKMAYHMLRHSGVRSFAQLLLRKQNWRLLSSSARIFFASNECPQYLSLVSRRSVAQPLFLSVRSFADVGAALGKEEIQTRVLDVLKLFDKVDAEKLTSKSHFINDLGLDSLDIVEIVMALEDDFAIEISDEEAEKVFSVEDAVEFIHKALEDH